MKYRRGPAAVRGSELQDVTETLCFGKAKRAANPSQKNCLYWIHFLTRERRGGDDCGFVLTQLPSDRLFVKEKTFFILFIYGLDNRHIMICHSQTFLIRMRGNARRKPALPAHEFGRPPGRRQGRGVQGIVNFRKG